MEDRQFQEDIQISALNFGRLAAGGVRVAFGTALRLAVH